MSTAPTLIISELRLTQLWLTLNRPDKANALTASMMQTLTAAITAAQTDAAVSVIVLTAAGDRIFCAGVDIREKPVDGDVAGHRERRSLALAALQDAIMESAKAVVVVLNGAAIGGGAMLTLLADACIAADSASISLPEIDIGIPSYSGANILEAIGGRALSLDLILSGRRMPAAEAQARGLVRAVVPISSLNDSAVAIAESLGNKDAASFIAIKRWTNRKLRAALTEARDEHARHRQQA